MPINRSRRTRISLGSLWIWLLLSLTAPALAQAPAAPSAPPAASAPGAYILGPGDVIETAVLGTDTYNLKAEVQQDGTITLPFINTIPAAGMTAQQLRNEIGARLARGGFFANPAVNVTITSHVSSTATILGQVRTPGMVTLDRPYRLSEVIARVGGVSDPTIDAITLTRQDGSSSKLSLRGIATGSAGDPMLMDGDKIFVAPAETFYIYGQVNSPGNYPLAPGMTVRMALARGGGLTALGTQKKVKLIRNNQATKVRLSELLQPGDVIDVGERFF